MTRHQAARMWVLCCALMVAAAGLLVLPGTARAATSLGSLAVTPATGLATSPISMNTVSSGTAKGCPAPSTNIVGYITGPGGWATGILGVNNSSASISLTDDFTIELADTFSGLAQSNSVTIVPGTYTITVYCADRFGTTRYGEFSVSIVFSDATHYQAAGQVQPTPTPTATPPATVTPTPTPSVSPSATPTPTSTPTGGGTATATTASLSASPAGTAVQNSPVTLTAAVSPASATGSVSFMDGTGAAAVNLGTAQVSGGTATFATSGLTTGAHTLTASFIPAEPASFAASQSAGVSYTITAASGPTASGSLAFTPANGLATSPISINTVSAGTTKGCPAPSTNVVGYVTGPGEWAAGILAVNNSSASISLTDDFTLELADTFSGLAQSNAITIVPGKYTITVYCANRFGTVRYGQFSAPVWFTDASHYQSNDPDSSQTPTQTIVTVSPADRADVGATVTLTAAITPVSATGSVQFRNNSNGTFAKVGASVAVSDGKATLSSTTFGFALYQFSAVFTPADAKKLAASTSEDVVYVVAPRIPPVPTSAATISGRIKVGQTITCHATFTGATSTSFTWIRDRTTMVGGSGHDYRLVKADGKHAIRCRALATNSGGTTSRTSRAARVAT